MKILHLTWGAVQTFGGIESHIQTLRRHFQALGHGCMVLSLPSTTAYHHVPSDTDRLPVSHFEQALNSVIEKHGIQVLHSHNLHRPHGVGVPEAIVRTALRRGVPHLLTIHDVGPAPSEQREALSTVLRKSLCITTSDFNRVELLKLYNVNSVVVPPTIRFADFQPGSDPEPNTITFPGRMTSGKGHLDVIPILGMLAQDCGHLTLYLSEFARAAYGESPEFSAKVREVASRFPRLHIRHIKGQRAIPEIYQGARLTICRPRMPEGFGLVPLESLACGTPVLAVPTGGMTWVNDVPGALSLSGNSILKLADSIGMMLKEWSVWRSRAIESRSSLLKRYDVEVIAANHLDIYKAALG